jgi:hypothetical protein
MSSKHVPADDFEDQFEDEELVQPVFIEQGWGSFVTVDGVPVVEDAARLERLTNVLKKILGQMGEVKDLVLPAEPSGKTKGYDAKRTIFSKASFADLPLAVLPLLSLPSLNMPPLPLQSLMDMPSIKTTSSSSTNLPTWTF